MSVERVLTDVLKMATVEILMGHTSVAVTLATVSAVMGSHVMVLSKTVCHNNFM